MVFGGNDRIPGAALLYKTGPICRIIICSSKSLTLLHVILDGNSPVVESPAFRSLSLGIDSPMDENPEFRPRKPFHTFGLLLRSLRIQRQ